MSFAAPRFALDLCTPLAIPSEGAIKLRAMPPILHEELSCRATNDFAVAVLRPGGVEALVTDHYPTARNEAAIHSAMLRRQGPHADPPATYHDLWGSGRYTWVHSDLSPRQLAVARLFRHEALDYEREPFRIISVVSRKKMAPILLIAVGEGARGEYHIDLLREQGPELKFRPYSLIDVRGFVVGGWRYGMKRFARRVVHPVLKPIVDIDVTDRTFDSGDF